MTAWATFDGAGWATTTFPAGNLYTWLLMMVAKHYLIALRSDPSNVRWLLGAGVALEGVGKQADAAEAYRRAEGSSSLTPEMASFLSERLARLRTVVVN